MPNPVTIKHSLIDKQINYILQTITGLNKDHIYNYYDSKGANPQKLVINSNGQREIIPYTPRDTFIMFGVEEVDTDKESYIVTPTTGGDDDEIVVTQKLKVGIEINGNNAQAYALKIKALMWRWDIMEYLEENNIAILTQNPEIQFMNEVVNEEMWDRRGLSFEVVVEVAYDTESIPEITKENKIIVENIENIKEENND